MRTIETALWPPQEPEPFGEGVFIGLESDPRLTDLTEGERILLLETNEVQVEAVAHKVSLNGRMLWFGEFCGEIQVIYPGNAMDDAQASPDEVAKGR